MKNMKKLIATFIFTIGLLFGAGFATASPVATIDVPATITAGVPFTATSTVTGCATGASGRVDWEVTWTNQVQHKTYTLFRQTTNGFSTSITLYADAASHPYVTISAKVGCNGGTNNYGIAATTRVVQAS